MHETIRERAENGAAVVISSHLLSVVEGLCTTVLVLHRGRGLLHEGIDALKRRIDAEGRAESLEALFFRLTESDPSATNAGA